MDILGNFITQYGTTLLYTIVTAVVGYLGVAAKGIYTKYFNDKTKQETVRTVVKAVEQIYTDLHGKDKLDKAVANASAMLESKGVRITEIELRMLIEAALAEFNGSFYKTPDAQNINAVGFEVDICEKDIAADAD